jgi:hypothetical protein
MKNFEFIIEKPLRKLDNSGSVVRCHVHASFPHIVYNIEVGSYATDEQVDRALSSLKIELIKEIANANWKES